LIAGEPVKTAVIVNPRSAGGKTGRAWPRTAALLAARLGPLETRFTERPGHATVLTRELLEQGCDRILAAGGDGTIHEVANGFLRDDQPVRPGAALGILPLGTGGDFRRTLGFPRNLDQAVGALAISQPLCIDVGKAVFCGRDGSRQTRYFVNLLSFGMGGEVAARSRNILSPLGGTAAFLYASAAALVGYRRRQVRLTLDGASEPLSFGIYNIAVGNGRFHGGGMQACPTAILNDGVFEISVIQYMSVPQVLRDFRVLYSDNIYQHPKVLHLRASTLRAETEDQAPVRIEVDGEPLGVLPIEISVLPQRLPVLAPASSPLLAPRRPGGGC
jgi:YegS/Rv2252/BmrU family lipid kinase